MSLFFLFLFACFISCLYVAVITHREHNNHHDDHGNHWKRGCFSFPFPFAQSKGSSFGSFATILFVVAGGIGTGALTVAHKTQLQQLVATIEIRRLIKSSRRGGGNFKRLWHDYQNFDTPLTQTLPSRMRPSLALNDDKIYAQTDGQTDRRTLSYKDARTHLKIRSYTRTLFVPGIECTWFDFDRFHPDTEGFLSHKPNRHLSGSWSHRDNETLKHTTNWSINSVSWPKKTHEANADLLFFNHKSDFIVLTFDYCSLISSMRKT